MLMIFYVLQIIIAILLIVFIMFQKSEGGTSLLSSNAYNSFFSAKSMVRNPLTRITIILGVAFFCNSVLIGALIIGKNKSKQDVINQLEKIAEEKENKNKAVKKDTTLSVPLGSKVEDTKKEQKNK